MAQTSPQDEIHLPPFVRYDCVQCGWCCGQFDITFSEDDARRLAKTEWGEVLPDLKDKDWRLPTKRTPPADTWRFATRKDGTCVFLGEGGACRMHTHTTEMGKALACTTFPFTIARTPTGIYVGLRFSCLSVAEGTGRTLDSRLGFLRRLIRRLGKEGHSPLYYEDLFFDREKRILWGDYLALEDALIATFLRTDLPLTHRVTLAWRLVSIVREWDLSVWRGEVFRRQLHARLNTLIEQYRELDIPRPKLKGRERLMFRQFCYHFQRRTAAWYFGLGRWGKVRERAHWFMDGVRFAFNRGTVRLPDGGPIPLRRVGDVRLPPFDEAADRMLSRYLAAKLFGKQVFGRLFFGYTFYDGFVFLTLAYAAILWLARGYALARGTEVVSLEDLTWALRAVDFCYNYSPAAGRSTERIRVRTLGGGDSAVRLAVAWGPDDEPEGA